MDITIHIGGKDFRLDREALHIAVPLDFYGEQPSAYGVPSAKSEAFEGGGFVGDTRRGGSCNFETLTVNPHCNGTHTECAGHITDERMQIHRQLNEMLLPASVVTVTPAASAAGEAYLPSQGEGDLFITAAMLREQLEKLPADFRQAVIVRTLPNPPQKKFRNYNDFIPPFFTNDAIIYLRDLGASHLLTDLPSIDRLLDEGKMTNHHHWWEVEQGTHGHPSEKRMLATVTEFIYVPDEIRDGIYILNLQIPAFLLDAAPSRPVLFRLHQQ